MNAAFTSAGPVRIVSVARDRDGEIRAVVEYADGYRQGEPIELVPRELIEAFMARARRVSRDRPHRTDAGAAARTARASTRYGADLGGLVEDAQTAGRGEVREWIDRFNRLALRLLGVRQEAERLFERQELDASRGAINRIAEGAQSIRRSIRDVNDALYFIIDAYLGGEDGREDLGAFPIPATLAGLGIVSLAALSAWYVARREETERFEAALEVYAADPQSTRPVLDLFGPGGGAGSGLLDAVWGVAKGVHMLGGAYFAITEGPGILDRVTGGGGRG